MRHRPTVPQLFLPAFLVLAASTAGGACGGVPFGDAPGSTDHAGDDGGAETSTITVGPPGSPPKGDAGLDATVPEHLDGSVDGHADGESDATVEADAEHEGSTPDDAAAGPDSSEPVDSAPPDAAPSCTTPTPKLCGTSCVPLTNPDYGCAESTCAECDLAHATSACGDAGECAVGACATGFADCNGSPSDGCETDITTATNCGKCGTKCGTSDPYCVAGPSGYACGDDCPDAGPTLCGATCVNEQTDPNHCGSCTKVCTGAGANATNECVAAACEVACNPSYDSCDGGCVNYADDNANCGSCGHACATVANGSDTCVSSSCKVTCNSSYTLCTNTSTDTCKNLATDGNNCGTCGHACPALTNGTDTCQAKVCTPACNGGYQLCTIAGTSTCIAPDTVHGVFVSQSSVTSDCGSITAPCGTIASGIAVAKAQGLTIMYVSAGTYAEQVTLMNGLTIEGGWFNKGGGNWQMECSGTDPSTLVTIQPTSIASGPAASVIANGVTATLSTLTVKSLATAVAGQSLYGIFASSSASVTMNAVEISVAPGGAGAAGNTETAPAAQTPPCAASDGNAATTAGPSGTSVGATYAATGYAPGNGGAGTAGAYGDNGKAGTAGSCETFSCNSATCGPDVACLSGTTNCGCSTEGTSGCGGPGGAAGTGGKGGGASIGLYAWGATVHVTGGSLATGNGGNGGSGGASTGAATSWPSSAGATGTTGSFAGCQVKTVCVAGNCSTDCYPTGTDVTVPGGGAGGNGGQGSAGGAGAGGSGGDSYAYFAPPAGSGVVTVTGVTATCGSPGTSAVAGLAGSNGSGTCH